MNLLGLILLIVAIYYLIKLLLKSNTSSSSKKPRPPTRSSSRNKYDIPSWLREHWVRIDALGEDAIKSGYIPEWYMHEATDRQLTRLVEDGITVGGIPTKGQASELIGLFEKPAQDKMEQLRFFKQASGVRSETHARVLLSTIFLEEENQQLWDNRPASQLDKEFYRFFKLKAPKSVSHKDAMAFQSEYLQDIDSDELDDWSSYCDMYDEVNDPDFREDYCLKKIALSVFREAVETLKSEGIHIRDMDVDDIAHEVLNLRPDLEKI